MTLLSLQADDAVAKISPDQGGGIADLHVGGRPILCPGAGRPAGSPFALAMNLLLPFSNRISRPFRFEGVEHAIGPNLVGEPYPIHGDAFQRSWNLQHHGARSARLHLPGGRIGPYRYEALVTYDLWETRLETTLLVTNRAELSLPFGIGFHPWFPRTSGTKLCFDATGYWPQDSHHLPSTREPVPPPAAWRFDSVSSLPAGWINTAYSGWPSEARLDQNETAVPLRLRAQGLTTLIVYAPGVDAPFVCLEPVSHPVDAHNLPGQPGLVRLTPGESLSATMTLDWKGTFNGPHNAPPVEGRV